MIILLQLFMHKILLETHPCLYSHMRPSGGKEKLALDLLMYSTLLSQSDRIYINYKMMQFKAKEMIICSPPFLVKVTTK